MALAKGDQAPKDCPRAAEGLQQVIAHGTPDQQVSASFLWAYLYDVGCGVARDPSHAQALATKAEPTDLREVPPPRVKFGRFYALIIGNNHYGPDLDPLTTAINDAREVAEILETLYNFQVIPLYDATLKQITDALKRLTKRVTKEDNLLIYYAGHGAIDRDETGAWLPVGAQKNPPKDWLWSLAVANLVDEQIMPAKRVLIVADSCYAGAWIKTFRGGPLMPKPEHYNSWIEQKSLKSARLVLTAGGLEPVADKGGGGHSVFGKFFIEALRSNSGLLTGLELFDRLAPGVYGETHQVPAYGPLVVVGSAGGEFFFERVQ
jgi:uncharacterized caspase-like protein